MSGTGATTLAHTVLTMDRRTRSASALALLALAASTVSLHAAVDGLAVWLALPLGIAQAASVFLAADRPWTAIAVHHLALAGIALGTTATVYPWPVSVVSTVVLAVLLTVLGLAGRTAAMVTAWASGIVLLLAVVATTSLAGETPPGWAASVLVAGAVGAVAGASAAVLRRLRDVRGEVAAARSDSAASRSELTGAQERARIAREMHDVVAHSMSLVHMRASSAQYRIDGLGDEVRAELDGIADQARTALTEMRAVLAVLHDDAATATAPQPGLDELPRLVEDARRAGIAVEAELASVSPAPSPMVQLAFYRVAQESLSNVVRHARDSTAMMSLTCDGTTIVLRVHSSAPETSNSAPDVGGSGIRGMIDRMTAIGGTLDHGPDDGGWSVVATAPRDRTVRP
jgi:signal transduction histidine kinase